MTDTYSFYPDHAEHQQRVTKILSRKRIGMDCDADGSAELKQWVARHGDEDPISKQIAEAFPAEFDEAYFDAEREGYTLGALHTFLQEDSS